MTRRTFYKSLYVQVITGIALGVLLAVVAPERAVAMRPLGDGFIRLIKMLIAPIIFTTVVVGMARMGSMREVGRIGIRALVYFEVVSTFSLVIGLMVANVLQPGAGVMGSGSAADAAAATNYASAAHAASGVDFVMNIIPTTVVDAFARGDILQVLLVSVLFGVVLLPLGDRVARLVELIDQAGQALFAIVGLVMRLAPIGAFGAMAFTVGRYGLGTLVSLAKLMAGVYITCTLFIFVVLGIIARATGFSLLRFLRHISEEILIVLGTSSSESVLPRIMAKLERLGCSKAVVGLVVPTGYSFNLDGTSIYMSLSALFVAQVSGVHLSWREQLSILAILLLTSKGAAGVTGSGFITLAATLSSVSAIPASGLALLVGVDRFMSEARAITNLIGNAVATMVVARWDGALDLPRVRRVLGGAALPDEPRPLEPASPTG